MSWRELSDVTEEFAMSYEESLKEESDSVFMRVIKESLWQELADITDKTQLEWREVFQTSIIMGFITAEKWSGWEIWSARNVTSISRSTHRKCWRYARNVVMTSSRDARLSRNSLISHSNKENMGRMKFPGPCFYLYSKSSVSRISWLTSLVPDDWTLRYRSRACRRSTGLPSP